MLNNDTIPDNIVEAFLRYENGSLNEHETVEFFQMLIDTGLDKQLQGKYERIAKQLVMSGLCVTDKSTQQLNIIAKVA